MKELSIEEKAKAYDEVLERVRSLSCSSEYEGYKKIFENIFPELAESEDEKIIYDAIKEVCNVEDARAFAQHNETVFNVAKRVLEKQGEQPKDVTYIHEAKTGNGNIKALVTEKVQLPKKYEKQGGQKPIVPKFRIGDNVVYTDPKGVKEYGVVQYNNSVVDALKNKIAILVGGCTLTYHDENELELVEQKPVEWSEKDEKMLYDTIQFIETGWTDNGKSHLIPWLKSLRPQKQWKPSDEQMEVLALSFAGVYRKEDIKTLRTLYEDLKAL